MPWSDEAGGIIKGFLRVPSPLCTAVGGIIREMGVENVSCHCDCQDVPWRFEVDYLGDGRAHVRDVACRGALLHARSLDPGLDQQQLDDIMHNFEVSLRSVTYIANVKDEAVLEFDQDGVVLRARTWEEVGDVVDMATLRHIATFWT